MNIPYPVLIAGLLLWMPASLDAEHPHHASFAEVEWNAESGKLEVALSVWPPDLEHAISLMRDRPATLETVRNLDRVLQEYVAQTFTVSSRQSARHAIRWVGHEITVQEAWLYFEIEMNPRMTEFDSVRISNRLFFEFNPSQLNHVCLRVNSRIERSLSSPCQCANDFGQ